MPHHATPRHTSKGKAQSVPCSAAVPLLCLPFPHCFSISMPLLFNQLTIHPPCQSQTAASLLFLPWATSRRRHSRSMLQSRTMKALRFGRVKVGQSVFSVTIGLTIGGAWICITDAIYIFIFIGLECELAPQTCSALLP